MFLNTHIHTKKKYTGVGSENMLFTAICAYLLSHVFVTDKHQMVTGLLPQKISVH